MKKEISQAEYIEYIKRRERFGGVVASALYDSLNFDKTKFTREQFNMIIKKAITDKMFKNMPVIINTCPGFLTNDALGIIQRLVLNGVGEDCLNPDKFITATSEDESVYLHTRRKVITEIADLETNEFENIDDYRYDTEVLSGPYDFGIYNANKPELAYKENEK